MKVGYYVRTDKGYITKISDFTEHYTKGKRLGFKEEVIENFLLLDNKQCEIIESIDYSIPPCYPSDEELEKIKSHIIKSSPNIIDLIKVGDYVNGKRVEWIGYDLYQESEDGTLTGIGEKRILFNEFTKDSVREKGIKSIVTRE